MVKTPLSCKVPNSADENWGPLFNSKKSGTPYSISREYTFQGFGHSIHICSCNVLHHNEIAIVVSDYQQFTAIEVTKICTDLTPGQTCVAGVVPCLVIHNEIYSFNSSLASSSAINSDQWGSAAGVFNVHRLDSRGRCLEYSSSTFPIWSVLPATKECAINFKRYWFSRRIYELYDQYRTALRIISVGCESYAVTPDQILRDRLVFGIRDAKAWEAVKTKDHPPQEKSQRKARLSENAGTVDNNMSCIRGNCVLSMVKPATSAISRTILQPSAVANLPLRPSRLLRIMKCSRHISMVWMCRWLPVCDTEARK